MFGEHGAPPSGQWRKTKQFQNEFKPCFNERFVYQVTADQMADGGTVEFKIMDNDDMSSDDRKGSEKIDLPPVGHALNVRLPITENLSNDKATPKLEIGVYMVPIDDILRGPAFAEALQDKIKALELEDAADDEAMANLQAQLEEMSADDEEDEAAKAALAEQLAEVQAAMDAALAQAAEEAAAKEAAFEEERAAAEAEAAEVQAAVEAAAEAAAEAGEDNVEGLQAQVAALLSALETTQGQLAATREKLQEANQKASRLEAKVESTKADNPVNQAKAGIGKMGSLMKGKKKKRGKD